MRYTPRLSASQARASFSRCSGSKSGRHGLGRRNGGVPQGGRKDGEDSRLQWLRAETQAAVAWLPAGGPPPADSEARAQLPEEEVGNRSVQAGPVGKCRPARRRHVAHSQHLNLQANEPAAGPGFLHHSKPRTMRKHPTRRMQHAPSVPAHLAMTRAHPMPKAPVTPWSAYSTKPPPSATRRPLPRRGPTRRQRRMYRAWTMTPGC